MATLSPDSACGDCRHGLKWHNPCSKCACPAFLPSEAVLRAGVGRLPDGSVTADLVASGRVLPSGVIVPKGAKE